MNQLSGIQFSDQFVQDFYSTTRELKSQEELQHLQSSFDADLLCQQMESFSVEQLVKFLRVSHDYYLSKKVPEIEQSLAHIVHKYGDSHSLLAGLAVYFNNYKKKLVQHIRMEEEVFFPYVERLSEAETGQDIEAIKDLLQARSSDHFEDNHDAVEDELREVGKLIRDYAEKTDKVLPFSVFLNQVSLFEFELRRHAVIEDMVLLKKVTDLENTLKEKVA
ncbi:hemerythrin domain-containing protein [Jiulongibacter sp. NS-SX5]|uniref:hemerythrin domain-containing protein n=1 Tax=Jiulongibacter sp. NS-SX5 TaxID=3463854 RepID=UPI004059AE8D